MKENFMASLNFVLRHECTFAAGHPDDLAFVITEEVPGDTGGLTKFGIDAADHPGMDIAGLTLGQATQIYHDGEWSACKGDQLCQGIDTAVFDCAVNCGVQASGAILQRAINDSGFKVEVDGIIGPKTVSASMAICQSTRWGLIEKLIDGRRAHYQAIVDTFPGDVKFLSGWLNRLADLQKFLTA